MVRHIGMHRANHGNVVDRFCRVTENIADFNSALPILVELERRCEGGAGLAFRRKRTAGKRLTGVFGERRLRVERVDVRRAPVHEQMDDVFGAGCEMRRLGSSGLVDAADAVCAWRIKSPNAKAPNPMPQR